MNKKILIKSLVITTMLAAISFSAIGTVFAWDYYTSVAGIETDESTWHVTARVTGYYDDPGSYPEALHQAYRGCDGSVTTYESDMYYKWWSWGGSSYNTGWVASPNEYYDFSYKYPATPVTGLASTTKSRFYNTENGYFWAEVNPAPTIYWS